MAASANEPCALEKFARMSVLIIFQRIVISSLYQEQKFPLSHNPYFEE